MKRRQKRDKNNNEINRIKKAKKIIRGRRIEESFVDFLELERNVFHRRDYRRKEKKRKKNVNMHRIHE